MSSTPFTAYHVDLPEQLAQQLEVCIFYTKWNNEITQKLVDGATEVLTQHKVRFRLHEVPGAVELTFAIAEHKRATNFKGAYIAFGCVIQGETRHFDYVCQSITQGITSLNATIDSPVIFGVLTVVHSKQAMDRLGGIHGHKGKEAASTALEMLKYKHNLTN